MRLDQQRWSLLRALSNRIDGHFQGGGYYHWRKGHGERGWAGVVSHVGSRPLADVADRTTLTGQLAEQLAGLHRPRARHGPGRALVDMAVAEADGAATISDVAVLADQAALFGSVTSDSTCWRLLDQLDRVQLTAIARAGAAAREVVWAQRAELTGQVFPPAKAAGRVLPGHPMLAFCDNTGEFLAAVLRGRQHRQQHG